MDTQPTNNIFANVDELREKLASEDRVRTFREDPVSAQVSYVIYPAWLPRQYANLEWFAKRLFEVFGLRFDDREVRGWTGGGVHLSIEDAMRLVVEREAALRFRNGTLRFDNPPRTTPISYVVISDEKVIVTVVGSTIEAQWVAQRTVEELWAACNRTLTWHQLQQHVQLIGYATATRVSFGLNLIDFFSERFRQFMDNIGKEPDGLAVLMGMHPQDSALKQAEKENILVVPQLHGIQFRLTLFNKLAGRSEDCQLGFDVSARHQANQGIITVTTELDSQNHTIFLNRLRQALAGGR